MFTSNFDKFTFLIRVTCRTKKLIKDAILANKFLCDLDQLRMEKLILAMYPQDVKFNTRLIYEGEIGEWHFDKYFEKSRNISRLQTDRDQM